ncbi:hypothetical protein K402DRAFT_353162 [Aulographum hederae CBS 113979]|uniref:Small ribosomal subunit protein mS41 n=1 Tax=Aulographum hederae CBS 113979 TaxID=1176131 RepID=A0A6G1H3C4_9PEZI|nr:hypothetical protein K402DRAFT_353162 [Aulographum hederae CBS 113979]
MNVLRPVLPFRPSTTYQCIRFTSRAASRPVPPPTPFIPDVQTFLKVIGRGLAQHAPKIPSWDALFSMTAPQFRDLGIEPPRSRKYLLRWRERFRKGEYGIGGDLDHVEDGIGEIRVFEVPVPKEWSTTSTAVATATRSPGMRKVALNVPLGSEEPTVPLEGAKPIRFTKIRGSHTICGPHVEPLAGSRGWGARIRIKEGLWEDRRGHKVDGGERRKAEVRAKKMVEERRTTRK